MTHSTVSLPAVFIVAAAAAAAAEFPFAAAGFIRSSHAGWAARWPTPAAHT